MTAVPRAFQPKIVSFEAYQKKASRTMSNSDSPPLRQAIWALGLAGEAIEVLDLSSVRPDPDSLNPEPESLASYTSQLTKELGDVCWYIAAICQENSISMGEMALSIAPAGHAPNEGDTEFFTVQAFSANALQVRGASTDPLSLIIQAGLVVEYIKKAVGHGHELNIEKLSHLLLVTLTHVNSLCVGEGIELEDVLARNIAKLEARYKKGFSTEASLKRVDVE